MFSRIARLPVIRSFGASTPIPPEYRRNFHHLTADVAWFGLLAGTTIAFLGVYAAHIGATAFQIGLLTAGPALVNLIFTMPAGRWLHNRPIGPAVFGAAVASRLLFLVYALVPLLLPDPAQIHVMIIATLVFALPGVVLAIGFNALFAAAVPPEWRGVVAGRRNAMLSLVYVVASLLAGVILNNTSQAVGYTLVFGLGFVGAVMSTYHLGRLRNVVEKPSSEPERIRQVIGDTAQPGDTRGGQGVGGRVGVGLRAFTRGQNLLRTEVLRGGFGWVILSLFAFHTAQYMPAALFPLQWVDVLHFSDGQIAMATAVFHISTFAGSLNLGRLTRRFGNHKLTVAGTSLLSLYPLLTALMPNFFWFVVTSIVGGQGWALVGGALGNYLLDKVPAGDRPAYLAWYNLALNAAILLGALLGPLLAGWFDIRIALILAFVARLAASAFIYFVEPKARTIAPEG